MSLKRGLSVLFLFNVILSGTCDLTFKEIIKSLPYDLVCDPEAECSESDPGDFVPDPIDCHNYYFCISGNGEVVPSDVILTCPDGEFFNATTSSCEIESSPCINECGSSCSTTCSETFDIVGYPGDCTKYYVCMLGGDEVLESCPEESPYFNGANCTTNPATCCDFCTPICDTVGTEIADPYDCRKFYLCFTEGIPVEDAHYSCPEGEIFDVQVGTCVLGTTCDPLCASETIETTTLKSTTYLSSTLTVPIVPPFL